MPYLLFAFALGSFSSTLWRALPAPLPLWAALAAAALAAVRWRGRAPALLALGGVTGVLWAALWGAARLDAQLPAALDKTDWRVQGEVVGLPERDRRRLRFDLQVTEVVAPDGAAAPPLRRLRLSWYGAAPGVRPGERWQLRVRLRQPRGFANPGGFDYAGWLFVQGVSATGYVRDGADNQRLTAPSPWAVDAWRWRIAQRIDALPADAAARGLLRALTIGDGSAIDAALWERMRVTGVIHLAVVSGLHIALAAGLGMLAGLLLGRIAAAAGAGWPARHSGALCAWLAAGGYALLAGFGLSTARAWAALSVVLAIALLRRRGARSAGLLWALALIALVEPLAPLNAGFWLSFGAVAALLLSFGGRPPRSWWRELLRAQWVVTLGTAAGLLGFQGQVPLLAPLVNLVAAPWIGVLTVYLCLAALALLPLWPALADGLWWLAGWSLHGFEQLLAQLEAPARAWQWLPAGGAGGAVLWLTALAGVCLLAPRGLGLRWCGAVALLAVVLAAAPSRPPLQVTVLDVGQGLAVVVETAHHVLVYDTGPEFGERFDAGSRIIAPYLRRGGWHALDLLLVSHRDLDHRGGAAGLSAHYPPRRRLQGWPSPPGAGAAACRAGQHWRWDGVEFRVLHPDAARAADNDGSCVLLVAAGAVRVLLAGDIERASEMVLLGGGRLPERVDLLVAPHHGSRTSSSPAFVARVRPRHVVYAAGYRHHFGHPHPEVVARYARIGAQPWNTASHGAVRFRWAATGADAQVQVRAARHQRHRYWAPD